MAISQIVFVTFHEKCIGQLMIQRPLHGSLEEITILRVFSNELGKDHARGSARIPPSSSFAMRFKQVLIAVVIPVAEALVHVPVHPEPSGLSLGLIQELSRALIRVACRAKCDGKKPLVRLSMLMCCDTFSIVSGRVARTHSQSCPSSSWLSRMSS